MSELGPIGGGNVQGLSWGGGAGQQARPQRDESQATVQAAIRRLQGRNNGLDLGAATQNPGVPTLQDPLPQVDFQWTYASKNGLQHGFKLTFNSARAGGQMQRGRLSEAHARSSESSLVVHARDEAILPFATVQQTDLQTGFSNGNLLHTSFQGREVMAPYGYDLQVNPTPGYLRVFGETSTADPTIIQLSYVPGLFLFGLATVQVQGAENLVILTDQGATFVTGLEPWTVAIGNHKFSVATTPVDPSAGGVSLGSASGTGQGQGISFGNWQPAATIESFVGEAVIQSPLPGSPLIVRTNNASLLVPIEPSEGNADPADDNPDPYQQLASKILINIGLGGCQPIGFMRVGNFQPAAYFLETNAGPFTGHAYRSRVASLNAYGHQYAPHYVSLPRILGAAAIQLRGGIALNGGDRVVFWTGREEDLSIFADVKPKAGYREYCIGLYSQDGQLFAEVNELPYENGAASVAGTVRACKRRYDFDLRRWHQVSDWTTLTEDGLIRWSNGIPVPVTPTLGNPQMGYMSAYGGPDLPFGDVTRAMHNYAMQARYDPSLNVAFALTASADLTWYHKFEPPAATNPYSLRGSDQPYASSGVQRWPALIFPSGFEYADKYFDYIETGGQDTGGTSSSWTVRVGEGGQLDETDPGPTEHTFVSPVNHQDRRRDWPRNATSLLFPQVELEITGGDDDTLTPQGLPFTLYGHVDLPEAMPAVAWRVPGRADG